MVTSRQNRVTIGKVMALGFLLATLIALLLSTPPPASAAVPAGKAFAWGDNFYGELGNDTSGAGAETNTPVAVSNLTGVKSVKAGCQHSLALKTDGTVWAWGSNFYGQLGNGLSGAGNESNVPVKVANIGTGAKGIAASNDFSLALMMDGTVNSWGNNAYGQLGNGTDTPRDTPGPVSNLSGVKAIASDSNALHVLALLNSGTVKSWGYNFYGQLGNGSTLPGTKRAKPVRVVNLTGVEAVATGGDHSLALLASGKVKSWGRNNQGELGNGVHGDGTERSTPGNVIGLSNVRSISGGAHHSLAVLDSGRASSWGDNFYGQLGNGVFGTDTDVPVSVNNLSNVISIDGGFGLTLAATQ